MKQYRNKKLKVRCCVAFCRNSSASEALGKNEEIIYHPFPRDADLRSAWLKALGKENSCYLPDTSAVCSQHFLSDDIYETESGVKQIATGAIPSAVQICRMCLDTDSKLSLMSKHKLEVPYEKLTGHPLRDQGNLKNTLCVQCSQILKKFERFREKSLRARSSLMDLITKYEFITIKHIEMINCTKSKLKNNIVAKVLEPDHCDLHIVELPDENEQMECDETVDSTETTEVKNEYSGDTLFCDLEVINPVDNQSDIVGNKVDAPNVEILSDDTEKLLEDTLSEALNRISGASSQAVQDTRIERFKYENDNFACALCFEEFTDVLEYNNHMNAHIQSSESDEEKDTSQVCEPQAAVSSSWDTTPSDEAENKPLDQKLDDDFPPPADSPSSSDNSFSVKVTTNPSNKVNPSNGAETVQKNNLVLTSQTGEIVDKSPDKNGRLSTDIKSFPNCVVKLYDVFLNSKYGAYRSPKQTQKAISSGDGQNLNCQTTNLNKFREKKNIKSFTNPVAECETSFSNENNNIQSSAPLNNKRTNTEKTCFICDVCRIKFKRKCLLVKHIKAHTFKSKNNYSIHMQIHSNIKGVSCYVCDYNCVQRSTMVRHMRTHFVEKCSCKLCDYKPAHNRDLACQKRTHAVEKSLSCKLCDCKSAHNRDLACQKRTHTVEKSLSCKLCDCKSAQRAHLVRHMKTHTGEQPSCKLCDCKSAHNRGLACQKRTHICEKPFSCKLCDCKSAHNRDLACQKRTHICKKPFSCKLCDYASAHRFGLVRHMRTHALK